MRYLFGEFELDPLLFQLRRGGEVLKLEPKIFDVLAYLIEHADRVVSKNELLDALWPGEFVSDSVLPRCIATARKALGDTRERPATIATVHGRGYRFIASLRAEEKGAAGKPSPTARPLPSDATGNGDSPAVPSPDFFGRDETLSRMRAALAEASTGRGRMLLLVGEPGIGKTRTAEELAAEARQRGARVVSGHCHEGEGAPAYWPWVQVLRGCVRGIERELVVREMGAGAEDIALLLPELVEPARRGDASAPAIEPAVGQDEARFRLFDSIARFLSKLSEDAPLVIFLDDLHWADNPSLLLVQYLAREMRESRLLLVGTYRDVELRRHHPLVRALGELAREPHCERLHLRGLEKSDVARFIAARTGQPAGEALVDAVHAMTEGNPFFIGEIAGLLGTRSREKLRVDDWSIVLPQSVREAIGRRLDGLSEECNRVLAVASVIGRDFDLVLLERVFRALTAEETGGLDPSTAGLLERLDEAVSVHILAAESPALGRYAFSHTLIRQTLYEELPIPLRLRLHQRVAAAMEDLHAADPEPYLSQIAHHLFQGAAAGSAEKAIDYAGRAARRAFAQLAYEEAAEHYERAMQLLDFGAGASGDAAEQRFEILLALADAQSVAGSRERSQENTRRAAAIARKLGRADWLARAALIFGQRGEAGPLPAQELRSLLEEALEAVGEQHLGLRARLVSRLSAVPPYQNSIETRTSMSREAVELARRAGDDGALFDALAAQLWTLLGPDHDDERLRAADDLTRFSQQTGGRERLLVVYEHRARSYLAYGDLAAADRETEVYEAIATELRQPSFQLFAKWHWVARALCDGRLETAEKLMGESFALGERIQHPATKGVLIWHLYWLLRQRDQLGEFDRLAQQTFTAFGNAIQLPATIEGANALQAGVDALVGQFTFSGPFVPSVTAYVYSQIGAEAQAREIYEELAGRDFADMPRDEWWTATLTHLAEMSAAFADTRRCRALYALLEPFAARNASHPLLRTYGGSIAHYLGLLAAAQRKTDDAAAQFEVSLLKNAALGARPALVRTQYEFGRLLSGRSRKGEVRRGQEMLRQAAAAAAEMGLDGLTDRIQKEIIKTP